MNKLDKNTESLLSDGLIKPPAEFRDSVMMNIARYEREKQQATPREESARLELPIDSSSELPGVPWWQWVVLTAGGVIGVGQVVRLMFSMWIVTTAG